MFYRISGFIVLVALLMLTACKRGADDKALLVPRLHLENTNLNYTQMLGRVVTLPRSRSQIAINLEPFVSEFEIQRVELVRVDAGLAMMLQLTEAGARALYRESVASNGLLAVLLINGNAIAARRLDGAINDGKYYTFVDVADEALHDLVLDLNRSIREIKAKK